MTVQRQRLSWLKRIYFLNDVSDKCLEIIYKKTNRTLEECVLILVNENVYSTCFNTIDCLTQKYFH